MHRKVDRTAGTAVPVLAMVTMLVVAGCASSRKQLESVAKDWCMTIRASQVVPVYPLTEDLQPGDVFLVEVPVQKQAEIYRDRGFLPLDLMVTRLSGLDYPTFYASGYWAGDFAAVPHVRLVRDRQNPSASRPSFNASGKPRAPRAAFPSYTFKVEKGMGAQLAIPVNGVPVALGLMGTRSAYGSVTISDAYTYAAPTEDLIVKLQAWAGGPKIRWMLANLARSNPIPLYLRVVQRVYLTGGVVISVSNNESGGLGVSAGHSVLGAGDEEATKEAPETDTTTDSTQQGVDETDETAVSGNVAPSVATGSAGEPSGPDYQQVQKQLNRAMSGGTKSGGSLQIIQASSRSVTMKENFDRPLVIGYLGFDFPILEDGDLGVPVATLNQLEQRHFRVDSVALSPSESSIGEVLDTYEELEDSGQADKVERARLFVVAAAASISVGEIKKLGADAAAGKAPGAGYVSRLREAINFHLAAEEPSGSGPLHNAILEALWSAQSKQE